MPKKVKLKLSDLNVSSFKTSESSETRGGGASNYPCDAPYTEVNYCTNARHLCKPTDVPPIHTEGFETVCQTVKTIDNCMFSDACF